MMLRPGGQYQEMQSTLPKLNTADHGGAQLIHQVFFLLAHFECAHFESTYCTAFLHLGYLGLINVIQHLLTNLSIK